MFWRSLIKITISTPSSPVFSLDLTVSCGWWLYQEMWRWTQIRPDYAKMSDYTAPDISTLKVSKNFADHNVAFTFKKYWDTIMIGHLNITDRRFGIAIIPKTVCQWRSLWTSVPISRVENIYKILRAKFCWGLYISTHWAVSPDSYYPSAFGFTQIHKYRLCASEIFPFIQRLQKKLYSENSPVKY